MCANFQLPGIFSRKDFQPILDMEEAIPDDIDRFLTEELPESQLLEQGENHKLWKGFKNPSNGKIPLRGFPPPQG